VLWLRDYCSQRSLSFPNKRATLRNRLRYSVCNYIWRQLKETA
jgi:hypothetical protein